VFTARYEMNLYMQYQCYWQKTVKYNNYSYVQRIISHLIARAQTNSGHKFTLSKSQLQLQTHKSTQIHASAALLLSVTSHNVKLAACLNEPYVHKKSVGMDTSYRVTGPGIESRYKREFRHPSTLVQR
jgi:hypothetical protein